MKKNGFIATSILYTFFLVFLTLFIGLVANYLHNRILLAKIEETSKEVLYKINNTKLNELKVGDHIKFKCDDNLLNSDATWIVAKIDESDANKIYYFISDLTAANLYVYYKTVGDQVAKIHPLSVSLYESMKNNGAYNAAIKNGNYKVYEVTSSLLSNLRNTITNPIILSEIINPGGSYLVYIDQNMAGSGYIQNSYYELIRYNFTSSSQNAIIPNYCGGSFNGSIVKYNPSNTFGYMHIDNEAIDSASKYISYCYYSSPIPYSHSFSQDHIVASDVTKSSDQISLVTSGIYNFRFVAERTISNTEDDIYIAGGKGTSLDPYIYTDGRKQ